MAKDLTIIYLTASQIPDTFAEYARNVLLEAIGDSPLISVSRKPLDFGKNLIDSEQKSLSNIYWQMLRAAKLAETEYVATAEDDTLYHKYHFDWRPESDEFYYDQNRFALFTWGTPMYHWRNRKSNCSLIAPRKLLIEALEERFAKWPQGTPENITGEVGRGMVEKNLGITSRKSKEVFSKVSLIQVNHEYGSEDRQKTHRKSYGPIRAYDIPHWGKAKDLLNNIHGKRKA
jgi:hypothetical protein